MSCQLCYSQLVNCSKCNFPNCPDCNEMGFCNVENSYICSLCYHFYNIRIFTCTECNITACSDCKSFFNCYLMLCDDCIKNKICISCDYSFESDLCIAWLHADECTCCICTDQLTKCDNCLEYNTSECLNHYKCTCKMYVKCANSKKILCDECIKFCKKCYNVYGTSDKSSYCYSCKFNMIKNTNNTITNYLPPEIVNLICSFC